MKLRNLLLLSLMAVLIVMTIPSVYAVNRVRDVRRIALDLREEAAQTTLHVGRIQAALARLDRYQRSFVATGDPELGMRVRMAVNELEGTLRLVGRAGYGDVAEVAAFPMEDLRSVAGTLGARMRDGRRDEATAALATDAAPLLAQAEAAAIALSAAIDAATAAQVEQADRLTAAAVNTTTAALIASIFLALVLALLATRLLRQPLLRLSGSMAAVASGRFEAPADLPYDRDDELGELSRSFRAMAMRLGDLDRMKAEFVGVATHDLKTPISVISGYAEMLEEELSPTLDQRQAEIVAALTRQARTLGRRVDQLLEISRMEASGLRLGLEEINVRHFTTGIEKAYAAEAARNRVAFSSAIAESAPSFLIADPDCLHREVLGNLLEHAFRFTPAGGRVHLHVSGEGGSVCFEVRDTGRCISADEVPHIFDRYYQGRGLGRAGSGLGLPIARAGAVAHGGDILVESDSDSTTFRVTIPVHPTLSRAPEPVLR